MSLNLSLTVFPNLSGHEEHLIPYSLVQPVQVETKRPVIFSPSLLSRGLIERLMQPAESSLNFNTCPPGTANIEKLKTKHPVRNISSPTASVQQNPSRTLKEGTRTFFCWIPIHQSRPWAYDCRQYRMLSTG